MQLSQIKAQLLSSREQIQRIHRAGRPSEEVLAGLTNVCDRAVEQVYHRAVEALPLREREIIVKSLSLIALGGYGRRELAPYSDIDLLFLTDAADLPTVRAFVSNMVRDLWDAGLTLGQSMRSIADCLASARQDLTVCTSLTEPRLVIGMPAHLREMQNAMRSLFASMPVNRFVDEIQTERIKEHQDYHAQTVLLLEPNLKKSPGGLRDYHVMRWVARLRYGMAGSDLFRNNGLLTPADAEQLCAAREFLHRLRIELHFHAGSEQDVLTRDEQLRLAEWSGFTNTATLLGVERFMQQYYTHTTALHELASRFLERARTRLLRRRFLDHIAKRRVDGGFLLTRHGLSILPEAKTRVLESTERIVDSFEVARGFGTAVEQETREQIRVVLADLPVTIAARRCFLEALGNPLGLGTMLRHMNQAGLIGRLLPAFARVHCLIQFNLYHRYTIDEHSLRAVEAAAQRNDETSALGHAYRQIRRKDLLHLALLLHDLGKGMDGDHCESGCRIARDLAADFNLNEHDTHLLTWLVRHHLLMAHTAFRRDVGDEATVVQFSRAVATPEVLRMLYVMTAADTQAVSPENWTAWKESLLDELYFRAAEELTGEAPAGDIEERTCMARAELARELKGQFSSEFLDQQLGLMPLSYLQTAAAPTAARHLRMFERMGERPVQVDSEYLPATNFVEYTICTRDDLTQGIFSKIAGVLAAGGFQIVDARIVTRADNVVIDTFTGQDLTFTGPPPASRQRELAEQIAAVLLGRLRIEELLSRRRIPLRAPGGLSASAWANANGGVQLPPQVDIDNTTSDRFTIIEVFAEDKLGRLYTITRTLSGLGLSIHSAKISTHVDQIVDAFYVTDGQGHKLTDTSYLDHVRLQLLNAIECP